MDYLANTQDLIKCLNVLHKRVQRANIELQNQIQSNDITLDYIDRLLESIEKAQIEDAEATFQDMKENYAFPFTKRPL